MLKIKDLSLSFGESQIFKDISFDLRKGEVVCLCGESGCGKTSMLRAILGFLDTDGYIYINGKELNSNTIDEIRKTTAYIPQDLSLPYDTVEQMVLSLFELRVNRNVKYSKEDLFSEWKMLGLDAKLYEKRITEISGGQRQRIMLSLAGLTGKVLILADEPTSALDTDSALLVARYFRMLAKERNMAILIVSHSETFANECDRIVRISTK